MIRHSLPQVVCFLLISFLLLFAIRSFDGFFFYDDLMYMQYAAQLRDGTFHTDGFFHSSRFGVFVTVAVLYKLFGVNEVTTLAWPVVCTMASLWLVYLAVRKQAVEVQVTALVLIGLDFYTLYFANRLYPDNIVTAFSMGATVLLFYCREGKNFVPALLFVGLSFIGFLVKTTIIYVYPFFLLVLLFDLLRKKNFLFWGYTVASGVLVIFFYLACYKLATGDWLYYLHTIETGHNTSVFSYYNRPFSEVVYRITCEVPFMLVNSNFVIPIILCVPVFVRTSFRKMADLERPELYWGVAGLVMLLMFWFSSTSLNYYTPAPAYPRMMLLCIPPFCICGAYGLAIALKQRKMLFIISTLFLLSALVAWYMGQKQFAGFYTLIAGLFIAFCLLKEMQRTAFTKAFPLALALCLSIHPIYSISRKVKPTYWGEKLIFEKYIATNHEPTVLVVEGRLTEAYAYFLGFKPYPNYTVINNLKVRTDFPHHFKGKIWVIVNSDVEEYRYLYGPNIYIQRYLTEKPVEWRKIFSDKNMALYEVPDYNTLIKYF